ncbi:MAG: hypothetical protein ACYTFA_11980 [Planctomycetota bacterium]|jgi:hypothetical protein
MAEPAVVDILRELLVAEQGSLAPRLLESTVFVSDLAVDDLNAIKDMARAGEEHSAWLTELILSLGGAPVLREGDMTTADLHYQAVQCVLPRLVQDRESLVEHYTRVSDRVSEEPRATDLVARILSRHQEERGRVQQLIDKRVKPSG